MKKTCLIGLIVGIIAFTLLCGGCRSQEQIEAAKNPTAVVPDVTVNLPQTEEVNTVTVSGEGVVNMTPDMGIVSFTVRTENKEAVDAQEENAAAMQSVTEAVLASGVEEKDIATNGIELYEQYDYSKDPATVVGFVMQNSITVTVRKLDTLGQLITNAIAAGATSVSNVQLSVSESGEAYQQALKTAMAEAQAKAEALAEASGGMLTALPVSVTESSVSYTPAIFRAESPVAEPAAMDSGAETPISEGELEITASVTVVFGLVSAAE